MANKKQEKDFVDKATDKVNEVFSNVKDDTKKFTKKEIADGKLMAILSYIGILALIPYFAEPDNKFVRYHAIQGMNLLILEAIIAIALGVVNLAFLPFWNWYLHFILSLPFTLIELFFLAMSIVGIIYVCNEEAKELPIVGKIKMIRK